MDHFGSKDKFAPLAYIEGKGNPNRVGFTVRNDSREQGGARRLTVMEAGTDQVRVKAGDEKVHTTSPDGKNRPAYPHLTCKIHYFRYDNHYEGWNLWMWPEGREGTAVEFTEQDDFGKVATVQFTDVAELKRIGLIVRRSVPGNDWAEKEYGERFISRYNEHGQTEIWLVQGESRLFYHRSDVDLSPKIVRATIDEWNQITLETNYPFRLDDNRHAGIRLSGPHVRIKEVQPYRHEDGCLTNKVKIMTDSPLDWHKRYHVSVDGFGNACVEPGKIIRSPEFDDQFYYSGHDLGSTYSLNRTKFRVWAPTAHEAKLVIYKAWDAPEGKEIPMQRSVKGTWVTSLTGNHDGLIYTYKVKIGDRWNEAVDPYAKAVTVNGDRGVVINLGKTNPKNWKRYPKPPFTHPTDAIIYELHIRDLSIHPESGITHKGKFLGLAEENTTGPRGVKTGLNHIKDLGVTHVQLLPIYNYDTASVDETKLDQPQYNWGYDPKNYNAPEGSYSTDPYRPEVRIRELKQMIQTLHNNGLRVIMDVVFNHTYTAHESNLGLLVPGYYYRYHEDGTFANGTGVGNDTASERLMMRKLIIDSVTYWAKEYDLDGFRFDLMGIHDVETMRQVRAALDQIDPSILIIGEGWDLHTPLDPTQKACQANAYRMDRIGHFNDDIRDALKGSVFLGREGGFINGGPNMEPRIKKGIVGGIHYSPQICTHSFQQPDQVVTYAEAHDNLTLWDKLILTNPHSSQEDLKRMHKLATSIILTSQGIAFLHAGQEFMRTKGGDENSYRSPDIINQLDWERRAAFDQEVEYVKGLIQLRKNHPAFRMTTADQIREHLAFFDTPSGVVAFMLNNHANNDPATRIAVIHNANHASVNITLPFPGPWGVLVNGEQAGNEILDIIHTSLITVPRTATMVLQTTHCTT
ncbi:type I pullulanase [Brevibacillus dissolubilis]|uniref:type I pullulanase n=1 Tax=Brevibacillus dissolubilis TaxID=1844116 RepID=UPI00210047FB|nr:type I pullulanase [Brevibacillus dissolubilis]